MTLQPKTPTSSSTNPLASHSPILLSPKSALALPMVDDTVELGRVSSAQARLSTDASNPTFASNTNANTVAEAEGLGASRTHHVDQEQDIMKFAREGDLAAIKRLFDTGDYDATYKSDDDVTPLHWAAINNQYALCEFLLQNGAIVNHKGGETKATALQWATQQSHFYIVNLLLQHGADPLITDGQGYNTLHIACFHGSTFMLALLLHQGIPVDITDSYGHSALMWAAYKGYAQSVDILLRWGASVHMTDPQGFTALHWALISGSTACIAKLIEYGADRFAVTEAGKTPATIAQDQNTLRAWHNALQECGFDAAGQPIPVKIPWSNYFAQNRKGYLNKILYILPLVLFWLTLTLVSHLPFLLALPISLFVIAFTLGFITKLLRFAPPEMRKLSKTPWVSGIFCAALILVFTDWLFCVFPATTFRVQDANAPTFWLSNLAFGFFVSSTAVFFVLSAKSDPGYVPRVNGIAEQKAIIDELLREWRYDDRNFCIVCMVRRPLRSKHCKMCQRCVARHDHHCPWVYNCVGVNNHRHFLLYVSSMSLGILFYLYLALNYIGNLPVPRDENQNLPKCFLLGDGPACTLIHTDLYTILLGIFCVIQFIWMTMLLSVQLYQVSRGITTYENMYGVQDALANPIFTSTGQIINPEQSAFFAPEAPSAAPPPHGHSHDHSHVREGKGTLATLSRLLGLRPFIETVMGRSAGRREAARRNGGRNPYSRGLINNLRDFFLDPSPLLAERETGLAFWDGRMLDYLHLYETPAPGAQGGGSRGAYESVATEV